MKFYYKPKRIVFYSGGVASYFATKRIIEKYGIKDLYLLFTDTRMEDEDLYRFLYESVNKLGLLNRLIHLSDGRSPWDVYFDRNYMSNNRIAHCSEDLKMDVAKRWIEKNCISKDNKTILYFGIDTLESHRAIPIEEKWFPYKVKFPLMEKPYISKSNMFKELVEVDKIEVPRLYKMGFQHNNCGGFCVKAGKAHFAILLKTMPERYKFHEEKELELIKQIGKKYTILREVKDGVQGYITLQEFRNKIENNNAQVDKFDIGGCGCFV